MSKENSENRLYPEDQARVDEYLRTGYNDVERKPFRPIYMMILVNVVTVAFLLLSLWIVRSAGIY
ncbi:MAG: hypothetical protein JWM78_1395 [Verrucomicrobiaceae bacterium]|nr:hypothetical protein [Verrucomicrobiaceae bacterium]